MEQMMLRSWPWKNVTPEELEAVYKPDTLKLMLEWAEQGVRQSGDKEPAHILALLTRETAWEMEDGPDVLCRTCLLHEQEQGRRASQRFRWEFNEAPYRYFQCDGCLGQFGIDS